MTQVAPTAAWSKARVAVGNVTTAQANSGISIVPNSSGRTCIVTGVKMRCHGSASGATGLDIIDNAASPVTAVEIPAADLTDAVWATEASSNTIITNLGLRLTPGYGLSLKANGTLATTTSVDYIVHYAVE